MAPLLRFQTAGRGFALNVVERHSPQAGFYTDRPVESETVHSASVPVLLERRDTIDSPSGVPVVSTPPLAASAKALAGLIVFLGIVVLGVAGLRLRSFLRNRGPKGLSSSKLKPLSLCDSPLPEKIVSEKRNPMFTQTLLDFGYDGLQPLSKARIQPIDRGSVYSESESQYVGWIPQISSWPTDTKSTSSLDLVPRPFVMLTPPAPVTTRTSRLSRLAAAFSRSPKPSQASFDVDVVPPYTSAAATPRTMSSVFAASPLAAATSPSPSPSLSVERGEKSAKRQKSARNLPPIRADAPKTKLPRVPVPSFDGTSVPIITVAEVTQTVLLDSMLDTAAVGNPIKSPTRLDSARPEEDSASDMGQTLHLPGASEGRDRKYSSSLRHLSSSTSSTGSGQESDGNFGKLPRRVTVVNVFSPTMQDELHVRRDEILRLTHEFRDGWCAVERLGPDPEQGVVPRFCIAERASFVPNHTKTHSFTNGARLTFTGSTTYSPNTTALVSRLSGAS